MVNRKIALLFMGALFFSCATFYELNYEFNKNFEAGDMEAAESALKKNKRTLKKNTEFLFYANRGLVSFMTGDYETSNERFEKAYIFGEDYRKNIGQVATSLITNPTMVQYSGEDHEHLMILYYKALNYIKLNDFESALVECRRLNIRLNTFSDKYKSDKKYKEDAFIHTLMGLIYDANKDYNNAFIAYRNAYNIYKNDYTRFFNLDAPEQLKKDILRTAYIIGFQNELELFEKEFGMKYAQHSTSNSDLIFLWHNGLAPIKDEWSINFTTLKNTGGMVTFVNEEYGLNFAFPYNSENDQGGGLSSLSVFRVAFPKYVERPPKFTKGSLQINNESYSLELAEDINAISFKTLKDRMLMEFGRTLLRVALKKAIEQGVREESEGLGMVIGLFNAATEKADTRSWQTIPYGIYYTRVPLSDGENEVKLVASNSGSIAKTQTFTFTGSPGKTIFHSYQTLY